MNHPDDDVWMERCLDLARRAAAEGEIPVGALVVHEGRIIGEGYNLREKTADPTAHAEVVALRQAAETLGHWRILGATLYVTLEPCAMCAGALVNARVSRVVYGCSDPKAGAVHSLYEIPTDTRLNHRLSVRGGVRAEECAQLLSDFFKKRRREKAMVKQEVRRGGRVDEGA